MSKRKNRWAAVSLPGLVKVQAKAQRDRFKAVVTKPTAYRAEIRRRIVKENLGKGYPADYVYRRADEEARQVVETLTEASAEEDRDSTLLEAAELYWVTAPMAAVAMDASLDVPEIDASRDMPCPNGFMAFEKPLPPLPAGYVLEGLDLDTTLPEEAPVSALHWYQAPDCIKVTAYARSAYLPPKAREDTRDAGPLDEFVTITLSYDQSTQLERGDPQVLALLAFLSATWVLMMTPTVAHRKSIDPKTGGEPRPGTAPSVPLVTTIDLRPLRHEAKTEPSDESGRIYRHRWVVRGHWRNQAHGHGRTKRRMTWVPSYIKGPEGAPLLATEKVMVWRR